MKTCTFMPELATKDIEIRNKSIAEIIRCSCNLIKATKTQNTTSCTLKFNNDKSIDFQKNTVEVILGAGRKNAV